jgi:hypothetical protein
MGPDMSEGAASLRRTHQVGRILQLNPPSYVSRCGDSSGSIYRRHHRALLTKT